MHFSIVKTLELGAPVGCENAMLVIMRMMIQADRYFIAHSDSL